jgi:hypothetical protein
VQKDLGLKEELWNGGMYGGSAFWLVEAEAEILAANKPIKGDF